ncbi:MAG: serine/threonine protein kinase [Anaerolineales bacterium]|nr:serine/threonine protein kinase [Anaerolineales bacterium]
MTEDSYILRPGSLIGEFTILEVIPQGLGGMARIVKASRSGRAEDAVALKVSRTGPDSGYYFAALHREVEILQQLVHPNIVHLRTVSRSVNRYKERAVGLFGSPWFFGMEFLAGNSLENYLQGVGVLSIDEGISIAVRLCDALLLMHEKGYAHNDLKPENIVFRTVPVEGEVFMPVLVDLGVAGSVDTVQRDGSLAYMSPERLSGFQSCGFSGLERDSGCKSDVWSMGVLLYRLFTGREPFLHISDRAAASSILQKRPREISLQNPDIPPFLEELILDGCLAKEPAFRASMNELFSLLSAYQPSGIVAYGKHSGRFTQLKTCFAVGSY